MNMKKILSSVLLVVMIFTAVSVLIPPVESSAAHSPSVSTESIYTKDQIKEIVRETYEYNFNSAAEMLEHELAAGYLDYVSSAGNRFTIYVNRYSGTLYYVNNSTGEILTSNPYNPGAVTKSDLVKQELMSQVNITFSVTSESGKSEEYNSAKWSAEYGQISVTKINNGIRVNYTMGDTTARFLVPGQITAEKFENDLLIPMLKAYEERLEEYLREDNPDEVFDFFAADEYSGKEIYDNGCINEKALALYFSDTLRLINRVKDPTVKNSLVKLNDSISTFYGNYVLKNPVGANPTIVKNWVTDYPLVADGIAVYGYKFPGMVKYQRVDSVAVRLYAPEYTFNDMYEDEAECKYVSESVVKPSFRLAMEYTFNADGSLSVSLPANSIIFDETMYTFRGVTPLPFFGSGNITKDGYVFVPDGSGAVIEYKDFSNITLSLDVYGFDYCYSMITGKHREQVSMPVYGMVSTVTASPTMQALTGCGESAKTGYFAILEEGASLAKLIVALKGSDHPYAATYAQFNPYPSDEYDLTGSISVGAASSYTIVSESKYTGSYVTRYVMLSDYDETAPMPDYNGMAAYYREYLKDQGVIEALTDVNDNLPLYIEALGSMEVIEKILSFPVNVAVPLTTFDDVVKMYQLLSDAKGEFNKEADRYAALAAVEEEDMELRQSYLDREAQYRELALKVTNITNVNFKLTGFANDGMYSTYPVRVRWEKCLGGKKGANALTDAAKDINAVEGNHIGIYPEFDFQYINYTAIFDGIGKRNNVSRMVDNRYASKQVYNTVLGEFETFYSMVISPDALNKLYGKFLKKYSKYDFEGLSVSTLGSDLNSNFDEDNPINRDAAQTYVENILDRMASDYSLMINKGNIYAVEYADHIVGMCTDSSHFAYSSYAIPFLGLVLHGYVNYAGDEMNYSGTPAYNILHSIENGSSLYYTLAMQNTELMKDDEILNKYFGVSFNNWYFTLVEQYTELNAAIGDLQTYEIVEHRTLIAERHFNSTETEELLDTLKNELVQMIDDQIADAISAAFDSMYGDPANNGRGIKLTVDTDALINQAASLLNVSADELKASDFDERVLSVANSYTTKYVGNADSLELSFSEVEYNTKYDYVTDSFATDENYDKTEFSVDNYLVTMVKYKDSVSGDEVVFLLNYNIYAVDIVLDANTTVTLDKYGYVRMIKEGNLWTIQ